MTARWKLSGPIAESPPLVRVYCRNPVCTNMLRTGRRQLVGEITKAARLRCPRCRKIDYYEVA